MTIIEYAYEERWKSNTGMFNAVFWPVLVISVVASLFDVFA